MLYRAVHDALRQQQVMAAQRGLRTVGDETVGATGEPADAGSFSFGRGGLDASALRRSADSPAPAGSRVRRASRRCSASPRPSSARAAFGSVIGQLQDTFIVSASDDEVFFIDQHVAHERVLFERLLRDLDAGPLASQELLFPQPVELGAGQAGLVAEWAPTLETLGFGLEGWSGSTVVLRAVPALLRGREPRRLIESLVEDVNAAPRG